MAHVNSSLPVTAEACHVSPTAQGADNLGLAAFMVSLLCCSMGWIHKDHHILPTIQHWQTEASSKDFHCIFDLQPCNLSMKDGIGLCFGPTAL